MAILPTSVDYTDKDFDSLRLRLQNLIRSVFPEWTDYNVANFGNILVELYAFVGDVLGYYQDNQALQSRITTATQRRALLGLVKLLGYAPPTATAATVDVTISLTTAPANNVDIPAGTVVATEEITSPIRYQTLTATAIPAGQTSVSVSAENSESQEENFSTTGLANQEFTLGQVPFIDGSISIAAGNGGYSQVDNFLDSEATDRHFTVTVDQNDRATVRFGNGVNGAIPVGNITITYKTGGGSGGRVDAGKIRRIEGSFFDGATAVNPTVTNPQPSSGGTDRATVAQIKVLAPASIRVINRTVAREDFEINALRLADVARALMLTSNEDAGIAENSGILFIIPAGGGLPSTALKDAVLEQVTVTYPSTLTFQVLVQDPVYKSIDVVARVHPRTGVADATVKADVVAALTTFFQVENADGTPNENVDFGGNIKNQAGTIVSEIAWSDVHNVVRDLSTVRKVQADDNGFTLDGSRDDVALTTREFPQLGTVTVINADTGQVIIP